MLSAFRDNSPTGLILKFFMVFFLALGLGGLVFMDVGGMFRGGLGSTTVAQVGNKEIGIHEFDPVARRVTSQQNISMEQAHEYGFLQMILRSLIVQELAAQNTDDLKLKISHDQIEAALGTVIDGLQQEDETRAQTLARLLRAQQMTETQIIEETAREMQRTLLRNAFVAPSLLIPETHASALYKFDEQRRSARAFTLNIDDVSDDKAPTDAQLRTFFEQRIAEYEIPESRDIQMVVLSPSLFEDQVSISEDDLRAEYEARREAFNLPERRYLEQAIVESEDTADRILANMRNGSSLKESVLYVVDDETKYREEEFFERESLLESLAEPVFSADSTGRIPPVESAIGWHAINITRIEEPREQSFEEVRSELRREAMQEQTDQMLIDLIASIEDRLSAGDDLTQIAQTLELEMITVKGIENNAQQAAQKFMLHGIYQIEDLLVSTFDNDSGMTSDILETDLDNFAVLQVMAINEAGFEKFEDVKADIRAPWLEQQKRNALQEKAQELILKINAENDFTLDSAATEYNKTIMNYDGITRNHEPDTVLTDNVLSQIFTNNNIGTTVYVPSQQGAQVTIIRLESIDAPEVEAGEQELNFKKLTLTTPTNTAIDEMYYSFLQQSDKIRINTRLLDRMYGGASN